MRRQNDPTASPSWRSIRMRSSSLPRVRVSRHVSPNNSPGGNGRPIHPFNDAGVRSWAKLNIFASGSSASPSSTGYHSPTKGDSDIDSSGREERRHLSPRRRTPVLTLALLRLEEQLPKFCQHLADPSADNVHAACSLIDSTVATASPSYGSPSGYKVSPSSQHSHSPTRSPIRSWLIGSSGSPTNMNPITTSARALESEWERFVLPLFLLAGAEFIYSSLGHSCDATAAQNLSNLYEKITIEINLVREVLCDPLLASEESNHAPNLALYYERASSLSTSLHALAALAQIRSQLIQFQSRMWASGLDPDFEMQALLFHELLPNLPTEAASAVPMIKELEKEVQCWKYLMKTTAALEQCRFADTILGAQKTKGRLRPSSATCIQVWMRKTLQGLISIFPIVFDRIQAFSKPLYGFHGIVPNRIPLGGFHVGSSEDLETEVLEFLRHQERGGGVSIAVSVVLDAVAVKAKKIERGFALYDNAAVPSHQSDLDAALMEWPAVYMRTTLHHGLQHSSSSHSLLDNMRRTSRSHMDKSSNSNDGSSGMLRPRSHDSSKQVLHVGKSELNVLEYAPQSGGPSRSWPHASWKSLVAVLTGTGEGSDDPEDGVDVDMDMGRPTLFNNIERVSLRNLELDFALPSWGLDSSFRGGLDRGSSTRKLNRNNEQTTFHISAISDYMWLVVMIKPIEESRWHRRRASKLADDEIADFLSDFSRRLRMAGMYQVSRAHEVRKETTKKGSMGAELMKELVKERIWDDEHVQMFLQSVKEGFRLRAPMSSLTVPLTSSPYRIRFRSSRSKSPLFGRGLSSLRPKPLPDMQTSAAALFLGPDLMHVMGIE